MERRLRRPEKVPISRISPFDEEIGCTIPNAFDGIPNMMTCL